MPEIHEVTWPYPGLRPFESWEGEIFFGREEHTNRLLDILQQQHFLAVIGPSGSGKSSLVRAGLLPALPLGSLGTGSDWRIVLLRPGNRPMQRLAHALLGRSALGIELVGEERIPQDERHLTADVALIYAELRRGPLGLIEVVKDARTRQTGEESFNLLVLVDQFEEIFTYADAGGRQADESEAFVNLLLASRTVPEARINIVLTMRTDFLGNCVRFLELPDAINRAQYLTPRLTREQIERAITGPAHLFEGDVEPTLVAELINAVSNDPDQLPILQHALARMWDSPRRRTAVELSRHTGTDGRYPEDRGVTPNVIPNAWVPAFPRIESGAGSAGTTGTNHIGWNDFNAVGGITEALSKHANDILASLSSKKEIEEPLSPEQRTAEVLFRAITGQRSAEAGGQAVRRPQSLDQIANWSGRDWQDFLPVVRAFAHEDVNFLNYFGELTKETVIDISHEALIRQWSRLREWVTDEAQLAGEYRRWRERAEAWAGGAGALLTGADLARAVEWRDGSAWKSQSFCKPSSVWAERYRSASGEQSDDEFKNVLKFIDESQQVVLRAEKRERRIKWFMAGLTVVSLVAMTVALGFWNQAHDRLIASESLTLWFPLNRLDNRVRDEPAEGILKLARSDERHKRAFLDQLLIWKPVAGWFNQQPHLIISAAVGLNLERRRWFLARLYEIPPENETQDVFRLARALALLELEGTVSPAGFITAIQATEAIDPLNTLSGSVAAVTSTEVQAGPVTDHFIAAIQATENVSQLHALAQGMGGISGKLTAVEAAAVAEKFVAAIRAAENPSRLQALAQGLVALPIKLTTVQVEVVTEKFIVTIKTKQVGSEVASNLSLLGEGLAALAGKATAEQARTLTAQLMPAIQATEDIEQLWALTRGVTTVAGKLTDAQAAPVHEQLVALILATENYFKIPALAESLAAVSGKLTQGQTAALIGKFLTAVQAANTSIEPSWELGRLADGIAVVAAKVPAEQAGSVIEKCIKAFRATKDPFKMHTLAFVATAVAAKLSEERARAVAEKFVTAILVTKDPAQLSTLAPAVVAVAVEFSEEQARAVAEQFLAAIETRKYDYQLDTFAQAVAAVASKLTAAQAEVVVNQFLAETRVKHFSYGVRALAQAVAGVASKLTAAQSEAVVKQFLAAIQATEESNQLRALAEAVVALPAKLTEVQAGAVAEKFLATTQAMQMQYPPDYVYALAESVAVVVGKLTEVQSESMAVNFLAAIQAAEDSDQISLLATIVAALTDRINSDDEAASLLFEILKNPLIPRDTITAAIRKRFPDAPPAEQGFWALIEWTDKRFPHLDLEAPLKEPSEITVSPLPVGEGTFFEAP